jgi:hypothetical protein
MTPRRLTHSTARMGFRRAKMCSGTPSRSASADVALVVAWRCMAASFLGRADLSAAGTA